MILATNRVEAARGYLAFGFAPVPIPARQKGPLMTGWQNFRATPADVATHFKGTGNLGILLGEASQGLTDVDLDCPETVELADVFLPVTGAEFGRPSKARSHRLYNSPAARTKRFKCPLTGATLVELRSDGGLQTVFPPSIHPSGEPITWSANGSPLKIEPTALERSVARLAAAALMVRNHPDGREIINAPSETWPGSISDPKISATVADWLGLKATDTATQPNPAPSAAARAVDGTALKYAAAGFDREVSAVRSAGEGNRNDQLNISAVKLGGLIAADVLSETAVRKALTSAALDAGLSLPEIEKTLNSGLRKGMSQPRDIPEPQHSHRRQESAPAGEWVDADGVVHDGDPRPEPPPYGESTSAAHSWPDPIPLGRDIPAAPAFPMAALPSVLADFVRDNAERMQAPPDLLAIPALVALAGCIGKDAVLRPKVRDDWQERACLWGLPIQPPGSMKTAAISKATASLRRAQAAWSEEDGKARSDWLDIKAEADLRIKAWESDCSKRLKSNPDATLPPKPKAAEGLPPEPKPRRIVTTDATVEKLAELMIESRGLTLVRDELAGWLLNMARYNAGSDRQFYLESYSGGSFSIDRIRRGEMVVPDLYINIIGGIQPAVARKLFDVAEGGDDGLLDRFGLIAYPELPDDWTLVDRWPDTNIRQAFNAACDHLVATRWENVLHVEDGAKPFARFSPAAQEVFNGWLSDHMRGLKATAETATGGFMGKARGLLCRLALVLHLAGWAAGEETDAKTISTTSLGRALTLLENYLVPTWSRVMAAFGNMPSTSGAHRIARYIKERRLSSIRIGDITKQDWTSLKDRAVVLEAFTVLVDHEWLAPPDRQTGARGGRPSASYAINPRVFELEG